MDFIKLSSAVIEKSTPCSLRVLLRIQENGLEKACYFQQQLGRWHGGESTLEALS
jgi:hypothetical protein